MEVCLSVPKDDRRKGSPSEQKRREGTREGGKEGRRVSRREGVKKREGWEQPNQGGVMAWKLDKKEGGQE